jgi:ankyrin repeat protein
MPTLQACTGACDHEVLKLLIKHKADLEARDCIGNTPLHLAACTNHTAIITELLQAGYDALPSLAANPP